MTREIYIDCRVQPEADMYPAWGDVTHVRDVPSLLKFTFTLSVDGKKAMVKEFESRFRQWDEEDEEKLAAAIMRNASGARIFGIYDVKNPPEQPGDNLYIDFSPDAKEMFEFLRKYQPKLLEMFSTSPSASL